MKTIALNPQHNQEKMIKFTTTPCNTKSAKICQSLSKPAKICQGLPRSAKVCESLSKFAKFRLSMIKYAKVCESLWKSGNGWEGLPKSVKVCKSLTKSGKACQGLPKSPQSNEVFQKLTISILSNIIKTAKQSHLNSLIRWNTIAVATKLWANHHPRKLFLKNCHSQRKHHCTSPHSNIVLVSPPLDTAIRNFHRSNWDTAIRNFHRSN